MNPADAENQGRFRFLHLQNATRAQYDRFKAEGIIRLLDTPNEPQNVTEAYRDWLAKWMKPANGNQDLVVDFREMTTAIGRLTYAQGQVRFENMEQVKVADKDNRLYATYKKIPERVEISIAHGSQRAKTRKNSTTARMANLSCHFCKGQKLKVAQMDDQGEAFELLEAFATRICVFDHRVHNRMYMGEAALQRPNQPLIRINWRCSASDWKCTAHIYT